MTDHSRENSVAEQPAPDQAAHDPLPTAAFFHDPAAFDALVAMVIPSLLHSKAQASSLRIWAPGCATGEETYSIAILIDEQLAQLATRLPIQLFATDVDASALTIARQGRYAARAIERVSPERLARYFVREGQTYQVAKRIRERCVFSTHNLSSDPPFGRMDLIVCRNLPTLLAADDAGQLMPLLHYALAPGGYLFLGTAAATIDADRIGELFWIVDAPHQIYQRKERLASARTSFSWGQRRSYQAGAAQLPGPSGAEHRGAAARGFLRDDDRSTAVLDDPQEIQHIRATLQATISQLEEANLDLTAMNEELCSLNEELQATNDELQIAKEESQAINEELQAVNIELSQKIAQLDRASADIVNLFTSTQLPVIFLHADGRIARFTPQATEIFALIDTDVGRPISDIATHLDDDLHPFLAEAIHGLGSSEAVVYQPAHDCWWNLRIRPYHTLTGQIDGLVLTFVDITLLKRTEAVLQESLDALERRVAERTQDLAAANAALQAEIAERTRSEQARRQLLQQIVTAQEEERRHIARELHDQMGQDLTALILGLKSLQDGGTSAPETPAHIAQLQAIALRIGEEVRSLAVQLRPSALDDMGLSLALSNYIEQWSAYAHVAADLHTSGLDGEPLPLMVETTVYRLVQEALTNVLKHAKASEISVIVERYPREVRLIIEDDGVGFALPATASTPDTPPQLGLIGMQERATLLGGSLTIESAPGSGTTIFARLPLPQE